MSEGIFIAAQAAERGCAARALGESIFTQAGPVPELHPRVRDAVHCHFDVGKGAENDPARFVRDEGSG